MIASYAEGCLAFIKNFQVNFYSKENTFMTTPENLKQDDIVFILRETSSGQYEVLTKHGHGFIMTYAIETPITKEQT